MTTPISSKIVNYDETLEATKLRKVAEFQHMLCNTCQTLNAGQCVRESGECPVDLVNGRIGGRAEEEQPYNRHHLHHYQQGQPFLTGGPATSFNGIK